MRAPDPQLFKEAMRKLAATVALVTTADGDARHGMPATAVTSLSAEPPSLLVCINRSASMHEPTARSGLFCVNLLANDQQVLCSEFGARASDARFEVGDWRGGHEALPYLSGAAASLFCEVEQRLAYGTHTIFVGRVLDIRVNEPASPLLFAGGKMGEFAAFEKVQVTGKAQ